MRKVFLDTNILIDFVCRNRPNHAEAERLVRVALQKDCELCVLVSSLKDAYFIYCRHYGSEEGARWHIRGLRRMMSLVALDASVSDAALDSDEPDYEDGLIRAAAERGRADAIISRDVSAFEKSSVLKMSAQEAVEALAA